MLDNMGIMSYSVSEFTTVDDMLLAFWQYMPQQKSHKYDLKVYVLVNTKTRFILNWEPYVGQQPEGLFRPSNSQVDFVTRMIDCSYFWQKRDE